MYKKAHATQIQHAMSTTVTRFSIVPEGQALEPRLQSPFEAPHPVPLMVDARLNNLMGVACFVE